MIECCVVRFVTLHLSLYRRFRSRCGNTELSRGVPCFSKIGGFIFIITVFLVPFLEQKPRELGEKPRACWAPRPKGAAEAAWHGGACANRGAHLAVGTRATWGCPLLKVRHTSMDRHASVDRQRKLVPGLAFSLAVRAAGHARHAAGAHLGAVERHLAVHRLAEGSHVLGLRRGVGGG